MADSTAPVERVDLLFRPVDAVAGGWDPVWCWPTVDDVPDREEFLEHVEVDVLPDGHYRTLALTTGGRRDRIDPDVAFEFELDGADVDDPWGGVRGTTTAGYEVVMEETFGEAAEPGFDVIKCPECDTGYEQASAAANCCTSTEAGG